MADYSSQIATAQRLIEDKGASVTFIEQVNAGADWNPSYIETEHPAFAVITDAKAIEIANSGGLVNQGDKFLLIDNQVDVKTDWKVKIRGDVYTVLNVKNIQPGGDNIISKVQVRK